MDTDLIETNIENIAHGDAIAGANARLFEVVEDLKMRPLLDKPRTVTLKVTLLPLQVDGECRGATVEYHVSSNLPPDRSVESAHLLDGRLMVSRDSADASQISLSVVDGTFGS